MLGSKRCFDILPITLISFGKGNRAIKKEQEDIHG